MGDLIGAQVGYRPGRPLATERPLGDPVQTSHPNIRRVPAIGPDTLGVPIHHGNTSFSRVHVDEMTVGTRMVVCPAVLRASAGGAHQRPTTCPRGSQIPAAGHPSPTAPPDPPYSSDTTSPLLVRLHVTRQSATRPAKTDIAPGSRRNLHKGRRPPDAAMTRQPDPTPARSPP